MGRRVESALARVLPTDEKSQPFCSSPEEDEGDADSCSQKHPPTCPTRHEASIREEIEGHEGNSGTALIREGYCNQRQRWPKPTAEQDCIGDITRAKAQKHKRDEQCHPVAGPAPDQ